MTTQARRDELAEALNQHASVNSTAGWQGSPDPQDWHNIRRVCKCGDLIGWHKQSDHGPLSGRPFDDPHRAHLADALLPLIDGWVAEAWDEGYGDDLTCNEPRENPYRAALSTEHATQLETEGER